MHVNNGRYSVSEDGTLSISSAHLYDSGRYVCKAVNELGSVSARVSIIVTGLSSFLLFVALSPLTTTA